MSFRGKNLFAFQADLKKFSQLTNVSMGKVVKKVSFDLLRAITKNTPFLTGRARYSWGLSQGSPSNEPGIPPTKKGQKLSASAQKIRVNPGAFDHPFNIWYVYNNLPYIEKLEYGHSKRAPEGMVRISIAQVEARMLASIRDVL